MSIERTWSHTPTSTWYWRWHISSESAHAISVCGCKYMRDKKKQESKRKWTTLIFSKSWISVPKTDSATTSAPLHPLPHPASSPREPRGFPSTHEQNSLPVALCQFLASHRHGDPIPNGRAGAKTKTKKSVERRTRSTKMPRRKKNTLILGSDKFKSWYWKELYVWVYKFEFITPPRPLNHQHSSIKGLAYKTTRVSISLF